MTEFQAALLDLLVSAKLGYFFNLVFRRRLMIEGYLT